ncbi:hypothetical protein BSKO_08907 [Bryopsis sp. KO-2023]|nr:hypothetical protein BSKO_08907 [Bryopsis sp. KO-2023]
MLRQCYCVDGFTCSSLWLVFSCAEKKTFEERFEEEKERAMDMEDAVRLLISNLCGQLRTMRRELRQGRSLPLGDLTQFVDRIDRIIRIVDNAQAEFLAAGNEGEGETDENREPVVVQQQQQRRGVVRRRNDDDGENEDQPERRIVRRRVGEDNEDGQQRRGVQRRGVVRRRSDEEEDDEELKDLKNKMRKTLRHMSLWLFRAASRASDAWRKVVANLSASPAELRTGSGMERSVVERYF